MISGNSDDCCVDVVEELLILRALNTGKSYVAKCNWPSPPNWNAGRSIVSAAPWVCDADEIHLAQ